MYDGAGGGLVGELLLSPSMKVSVRHGRERWCHAYGPGRALTLRLGHGTYGATPKKNGSCVMTSF